MTDSIDDLARRWRAEPDASATISLCEAIRLSAPGTHAALVDEVGKVATVKHAAEAPVLLSVARLYGAVERLSDAQAVLVTAGRVAPRDPGVYRLLGEVLLRRGDAERAEKVLQRAKQLGANDAETAMWMDRAKVFKPVQAKAGARAVAIEVKNTAIHPVTPHPGLLRPARPRLESIDQDALTSVRSAPVQWPPPEEAPKAKPKPPPLAPRTEANPRRGVRDVPADAPLDLPSDALRRPTGPMAGAGDPQDEIETVSRAAPAPETPVPLRAPYASIPETTEISAAQPDFVEPRPARPAPKATTAEVPTAREVLEALSHAGVFEPREAQGSVVWDKPNTRTRKRTAIGLSVAMVLVVGGSFGVLHEVRRRRAIAHDQAEATLAKVEADLDTAKASMLPEIEKSIGHAFELDSRSPRAARDWLAERATKGLLQGGAEIAFEDAMGRATEVKVPEEKIAFARVCAFLFQGDTGGAAGLMPKWDGPAANEPLYQLVTGATLDHAGDPHAAERYQAAVKLAPKLVLADILLARATAIDGDPAKAAELAKQFRTKYPDRAEGAALVALAWARDPARSDQPPPDVAETISRASELPLPLLVVPHALQAIAALDKHATADAKAEIEKGLAVADDPGMATWLGSLALETHDEPLVRKAALLAVTFSAVYAPARVLAARIALLGGRLDEALKATEDLDPTSVDVAIVRAAVAYERDDTDAIGRALEALSPDARKLAVLSGLNLAPDILLGRDAAVLPPKEAAQRLLDMSGEDAPWSDLIAMDAALDLGLIDVADKIAEGWKGTEGKPLRALRLSRLARFENHLDEADHDIKTALSTATVTPRMLIERAMVLVAENHASEVGPLLAHYPLVLGPGSSWLSAYALASTGKLDEARGRTAQLDAPPALTPLLLRVMVAVSLAAMKDKKRADPAIKELLAAGILDPDLLAAAVSIGIKTPGAHIAAKRAAGGRRR
jgi:predicted Zn-dependent protease